MLRGDRVLLRARHEADVAVLTAEHDDVEASVRSATMPWRPISPDTTSPWAVREPSETAADFSVVTIDGDELAGRANLWGIDPLHRSAHIGIRLLPAFHGKGLGTDVVSVLCHYGFVVLGLHRIQVETSMDNHAMRKAAERNGFVQEAVVRGAYWMLGGFDDDCVLGLLADEWGRRQQPA